MNVKSHPLYSTWASIKTRTTNPNSHSFKNYGAKGVRMCDEWSTNFFKFVEDLGMRPTPEHTLDRFPDRDGDYEPGNVRWATRQEQAENRGVNRFVNLDGEAVSLSEFARRKCVNYYTLRNRIDRLKETPEQAVVGIRAFHGRPRICSCEGCSRPVFSRGMCNPCYQKSKRKPKGPLSSNNTSGFKGVSFHKPTQKWAARVTQFGKRKHIGLFNTASDAAKAIETILRKEPL